MITAEMENVFRLTGALFEIHVFWGFLQMQNASCEDWSGTEDLQLMFERFGLAERCVHCILRGDGSDACHFVLVRGGAGGAGS
jgi:hypothetical protein